MALNERLGGGGAIGALPVRRALLWGGAGVGGLVGANLLYGGPGSSGPGSPLPEWATGSPGVGTTIGSGGGPGAPSGDDVVVAQAMADARAAAAGGGVDEEEDEDAAFLWADYDDPIGGGIRPGTARFPDSAYQPLAALNLLQGLFDPDMSPSVYRGLQEDLYLAGYYETSDPEHIAWGQRNDLATFEAWRRFVNDAAAFAEGTAEPTSWHDILKSAVENGILQGASLAGEAEEEGPGRMLQLTNPAQLGALLDQTAFSLLGRNVDAETKRVLVATVHQLQREQQNAIWESQQAGGPDIELTGVSPEAEADQLVRERYGDEAMAHSMNEAMGVVMQMIQGANNSGGF